MQQKKVINLQKAFFKLARGGGGKLHYKAIIKCPVPGITVFQYPVIRLKVADDWI